MSEEHLRQQLREAADAHRPDRARMLARVERGMHERPAADEPERRPAVGWVRIAGITAGVVGALAVGGFAVGSALRPDPAPRQQQVAVSPTQTPPQAGNPLWADGSVDPGSNAYWAQSNVTFKTNSQLTGLTVELRVAQTGKVNSTGHWRSLPADDFTESVTERDGFLVYRWVLRPGRSVPVGEHVFAGQYNHAEGGRDAGADDYVVTGRTRDGQRVSVDGDFAEK
ncbi:hypothetical protein ACOKM3_31005 [Streptomyces sp. BH106]|uniref:hypothetical protein n=1 Tax=Streptomyces sp. BH106 TaxID=3410409 RepID=UPI003CF7B74C